MYNNKIISQNEIEPILYDMKKVYLNDDVQKFLGHVLSKHENYNTKPPYSNYLKFCQTTFK